MEVEGKGSNVWWPMEGKGGGSHVWWPMKGKEEAPFHPFPLSPQ
jgi:hypothetical protein